MIHIVAGMIFIALSKFIVSFIVKFILIWFLTNKAGEYIVDYSENNENLKGPLYKKLKDIFTNKVAIAIAVSIVVTYAFEIIFSSKGILGLVSKFPLLGLLFI